MSKHFEKVKTIAADLLGHAPEDVKPESMLGDDLGADSLDVVELIMNIEKEYNIAIPDKEGEKFVTIKDITDFLDREVK